MTVIPPIKSQGIKSKLVEWIASCCSDQSCDRWVEPFMGTGVVAFNIQPARALLCDSNPHLINFYKSVQAGAITGEKARDFLTREGAKLLETEGDYYYEVRNRFNKTGDPFDFLFLSRSCFNGMMRFNKKGGFNVPFCRKPNRFARSLVTKISNQVSAVSAILSAGDYEFRHQDFRETLSEACSRDLVYCDPPYIGRHVDYYDSWSEEEEKDLKKFLVKSNAEFIISTWMKNKYRVNDYIFSLWGEFDILLKEHFYHVGAKESNRNAVLEALLINFQVGGSRHIEEIDIHNISGFSSGENTPP